MRIVRSTTSMPFIQREATNSSIPAEGVIGCLQTQQECTPIASRDTETVARYSILFLCTLRNGKLYTRLVISESDIRFRSIPLTSPIHRHARQHTPHTHTHTRARIHTHTQTHTHTHPYNVSCTCSRIHTATAA